MQSRTKNQVDEFLNNLDHPLKKEIEQVRRIILETGNDLTEHIKWNAPSFCHNGEDRITFNLHGKNSFRLIFHRGAKVKDKKTKERLFEDHTELLTWASPDRAIAEFDNMDDVNSKRAALKNIVRTWLERTNE
jgi:uncharacterized protein YdeI (YjbR/CyaY-like superfamily)